MYLSLTELKTRLGITDNTQDSNLGILLDDSRGLITSLGLDYSQKQRTKIVDSCSVANVYFDCPEVISIDQINGVNYAGVKDTDYIVLNPKNALVHFCVWLPYSSTGYKTIIKYTSGYATIPSDLKLLQFYIILALQLEMRSMQNAFNSGTACQKVQKIKMGPREITYVDDPQGLKNALSMYDGLQSKIDNIIDLYKLHVI